MPQNPEQEIQELVEQLRRHDDCYYNHDRPQVSDGEYDRIKARLAGLEDRHPHLLDPNSPTRRVGGKPDGQFASVAHDIPMLSLSNAFSREEFQDWHSRTGRLLGQPGFAMTAEIKIDGLAVRLDYRDGNLELAATRGNGQTGEDVTHNIRTVRNLPLALRDRPPGRLQTRGEVYLPAAEFRRLNAERTQSGDYRYANPRNAAAGAVRQLDPAVAHRRNLRIWTYSLVRDDVQPQQSHWENLERMTALGLPVNPRRKHCASVADVQEYYYAMLEIRSRLGYDADGVVVKVDSIAGQQELGATGHQPRWAVAWKFPAPRVATRLNAITVSVGRFGKITPVAQLEPAVVDGVTVRHASLHNADDIRLKDIRPGDQVILERAGGVIPYVVGPVNTDPNRPNPPFTMPERCPSCGHQISQRREAAAHWCWNEQCGNRPYKALKHFVSKDAMDIDGFGPTLARALIDRGLVSSPGDIYRLSREDLLAVNRMGPKSADRILANIARSRQASLSRVLYSLGIFRLGHHVSAILAGSYASLDRIARLSREELMRHEGIKEKTADAVIAGFSSPRVQETIAAMKAGGIQIHQEATMNERSQEIDQVPAQVFAGMKVCVTGALQGMTRDQAHGHIIRLGGAPVSGVTKTTSLLVVGAKPGSKLAKARQNGIPVWDEEQFREKLYAGAAGTDERNQTGTAGNNSPERQMPLQPAP